MEWPVLHVPVWLGGMETRVLSTPTTAVMTHASMAHVRYVLARENFDVIKIMSSLSLPLL